MFIEYGITLNQSPGFESRFIGEGRQVKSETGDGEETGRTILSEARINTDLGITRIKYKKHPPYIPPPINPR